MADYLTVETTRYGVDIAADDVDGVRIPRVKLVLGDNNTNDGDASSSNPIPIAEGSLRALSGGQCQAVSISGTSAQSAAITTGSAVVTPTVDCFFRADSNPTALSNGTDHILLGGNQYRIFGITSGHKLAFITTGATGFVHIAPGA